MSDPVPATAVDLDALLASICARIAEAFPQFGAVEVGGAPRTGLPLPAVLVELEDFEAAPEEDPWTEQLAVLARFRALLILSFAAPDARREIRRVALAMGAAIHQQRWGHAVGAARVTLVAPFDFEPVLDQYEVWSVEWEQVLHVGESVFDLGVVPASAEFSFAPDIGPGHEEDYRPLEDLS